MREQNIYKKWIRTLGSILILIFSMIILDGCLSEIDFDLPENESESIAIVARLEYGEPSIASVRITKLANFIGFDQAVPILDARVTLFDESGNSNNLPTELEPNIDGVLQETGKYGSIIKDEISVQIGGAYMIRIEIEDRVYESSLESLADVPKTDDISARVITREELNNVGNLAEISYLQFFLTTALRAATGTEKVYLKWDFEGVYRVIETAIETGFIPAPTATCYITRRLSNDKIKVFNGRESREDVLLEEFVLEERLDHRFSRGFYLSVFQQSISQGAYNYWNQIDAITDLSGNFFEDPPGKVLGNISNINDPNEDVFGYFYTSSTDTTRLFLNPSDYLVKARCPVSVPPDDASWDETCFNCLKIVNSTTVKPKFWLE